MNQKPHFTLKHALACLCLLPFTLLSLSAQTTAVPNTINYQGTLLKADGNALDSDNYTLTFRLYSAEEGGALIWGPQVFDGDSGGQIGREPQVPVIDGQFNVILGSQDINGDYLAEAFNGSPRYLEVTIGNEDSIANPPIAPRQQILSAPFALQAENAANAVPVGTIISLHPLAPAPNPNFWQLCDGTDTIEGSRLHEAGMETTPVLTDERFLMGGANDGTVANGGSNSISGHNHTISGHGHGKGSLSGNTSTHGHDHELARDQHGSGDRLVGNFTSGTDEGIYYHGNRDTSYESHSHSLNISGSVGNINSANGDNDINTTSSPDFDNRPQYFKVVYYIKIN